MANKMQILNELDENISRLDAMKALCLRIVEQADDIKMVDALSRAFIDVHHRAVQHLEYIAMSIELEVCQDECH